MKKKKIVLFGEAAMVTNSERWKCSFDFKLIDFYVSTREPDQGAC